MKFYEKFSIKQPHQYFSIFLIFLIISPISNQQSWCWTRNMSNEPGFILNESNGGLNWAFVQDTNNTIMKMTVEYIAEVETSDLPRSGTCSVVKIILYSDTRTSEAISISEIGFEIGGWRRVKFQAEPMGPLKRIKVMVEGEEPWRMKAISITSINGTSVFENYELIKPCGASCSIELEPNGPTPYEVSIRTDEAKDSGNQSTILIQLIGSEGFTPFKLFSENGVKPASIKQNEYMLNDIGDVIGFKLSLISPGQWRPTYLTVENKNTKKIYTFILKNVVLINPGIQAIYSQVNDSTKSDIIGDPINSKENDPNDILSQLDKDPNIKLDMHDTNGGLLQPNEKDNILELTCEQELVNPDPNKNYFGPEMPTSKTNYINIIAKCPHDCHMVSGIVLGHGIHPMQSSICLAALYDKAISLYGGIISISIYPGLKKYPVSPKYRKVIGNINIKSYEFQSKKSFVVAKVDNVDLIELDIRILDYNGNLANEGRLEMRKDGVWGTACITGANATSALVICKSLGYLFGEWKNLKATGEVIPRYCKHFKGRNYCGAEVQPIHYSNLECTFPNSSFNSCGKKIAETSECAHPDDAIIKCSMVNFVEGVKIPEGVIRYGAKRLVDQANVGRIEMMSGDNWLPICNLGMNKTSIKVLCESMGFTRGELTKDPDHLKEFQLPINSEIGFAARNFSCKGNEKKLSQCSHETFQIDCRHDQDLVVNCYGEKGDTSGESQWNKVKEFKPELGKLVIPNYDLSCEDQGLHPNFRGDPGSVYIVKCPKDCLKKGGIIYGTGLYTADSNICKSAIHAGLIDDEVGGIVAMTKALGLTYYEGTMSNKVISSESITCSLFSFHFSKLNTAWIRMNEKFKDGGLPVLSTVNSQSQTWMSKSLEDKFMSFIELDQEVTTDAIIEPVFKFFSPSLNYQFTQKNTIFFDRSISGLNKYTFVVGFKMSYFKAQPQYIFSNPGCSGFNLFTDKDNILNVGDPCDKERFWMTDVAIPLDDKVIVYIYFEEGIAELVVKTEKTKLTIVKKQKINLIIDTKMGIGIGRLGQVDKYNFNGLIEYIFIFDHQVPLKGLGKIINAQIKDNQSIAAGTNIHKTQDERVCISPIMKTPTPPSPDAGNPPKDALADFGIIMDEPQITVKQNNQSYYGFNTNINSSQYDSSSSSNSASSSTQSSDYSSSNSASSSSQSSDYSNSNNSASSNSQSSDYYSSSQYSDYSNNQMNSQSSDYSSSQMNSQSSDYSISQMNSQINSNMNSHMNSQMNSNSVNSFNMDSRTISSIEDNYGVLSISGGNSVNVSEITRLNQHGHYAGISGMNSSSSMSSSMSSQSSYASSFSSSSISQFNSFSTKDISMTSNIETLEIECETLIQDYRFTGAPGTFFRVRCPSTCQTKLAVFGSQIYHPLSSICGAAYHSGIIKKNQSKEIIVVLIAGKKIYNGSTGIDGTTSGTFGSSLISFSIKEAKPIRNITCQQSADKGFLTQLPIYTRLVLNCPAMCSKFGEVYGSEVYADSSQICKSAIHFGVLNDRGGEVDVLIEGGVSFYQGKMGFGIKSKDKEGFNRSFRFLGAQTSIFYNYFENFSGQITDRWVIEKNDGVLFRESDQWQYVIFSDMSYGIEKKIKAIVHKGKITGGSDYTKFGALIKLKNADWSNGKISFNFITFDRNPFAIFFRYTNKNTYYGIIFDFSKTFRNVKLISVIDGNYQVLETKTFRLMLNKTYMARILLDFNFIKFNLQTLGFNDTKFLFSRELNLGLARGSLAFATYGNTKFFITGVEIVPYTNNMKYEFINNRRSFGKVLQDNTQSKKKRWCNKIFKLDEKERLRCLEDHVYCKLRCDDLVPPVENIHNFNCYRQCYSKIIEQNGIGISTGINLWKPTELEKIDFIKPGDENPRPAIIQKIELGKKALFKIKYSDDDGNFRNAQLKLHMNEISVNPYLFRCGSKLSNRTDCKN